ncbi:translation initiation factor IF-2 [Ignavibacterium album]|uniref:translation initiation factor IF-2 n=1 Tax=Ignavibacterium album TaxID=591197 RepID=UPI0026F21CE8|nr:translation initiation factor IF-2 [Ignavibacterium album]
MAEEKTKKVRIHKLASEINLSSEVLIDFLRKKGHEVKSIQSIVTDEMLHDIQSHFKKEIEKAAQHTKKVEEFKKKFSSKSDKESREKSVSISDEVAVEEPPQEIVITEQTKIEAESEVLTEADQNEQAAPEITEEQVEADTTEVVSDKVESADQENFVQPRDTAENKVKGLKILGKVDLDEGRKRKKGQKEQKQLQEQPKPKVEEKKEETKSGIIEKVLEEPVKKKKKRPKAKKKASIEPVAEELESAKKKKRVKKFEIDEKDVKAAIKQTLLSMDETVGSIRGSLKRKKKREREAEQERLQELKQLESKKIKVNEFIAVNELANLMNVPVSEVIAKCISMGLMVSINQRLDVETITLVADEFGFEVEFQKEYTADVLEDKPDPEESLKPRPPVVTIMGHVDHGKTSLLDYIRNTNVVAGEAGGITQHIGAYQVELPEGKLITFLDTPGHEAFTAMRARGAQLTDIVVLVVAADDAVMPQTVEALNHAQAANVPIIVAINKIDKPGANPDKIKQQLADRNLLVEDWGGKYQCVELSAKTGKNIDLLLEKILLEAEILDLKANPDRPARGAVVEAELDKGRGVVATILVQKGTLRVGDPFVAGIYHGRVRAMFDERGNKVKEAPPSTPVQVLGFEGVPQAGDTFVVVESERDAREIALKRQQLKREQDQKQVHHLTLDEIAKQISIGGVKELPLIVKGDVDGSVEALSDSFMKLTNQEVVVRVIHKGVGGISESDVLLAAASNAIIIGFNVRPNLNARKLAETQKVDIRLYSVIYDAINEVKSALEGLLSPVLSEEITATVEVREVFKVPKVGTVAGCYVTDGKIARSNKIRIIRDGIVIHQGEILSLKRFKDDVREVDAGYECGISIVNFNDIKVGDIIEGFKIVETKKTLA